MRRRGYISGVPVDVPRAEPPQDAGEPAPSGPVGRLLTAVRADALVRSSSLLVADHLLIGAIGAICSVIAARSWSPHDIGTVGAIAGVASLLSTATSTGVASTITRFLAGEDNQRRFVLEAVTLTTIAGALLAAIVCFVPGHFGVPLHDLPVSAFVAFGLMGGYAVATNIVAVTDPAFISRKEVSYPVVKDVSASVIRVGVLIAFIGTGSIGLFCAGLVYVGVSATMDLGLVAWRLRDRGGVEPLRSMRMLRSRLKFAAGSHTAALVAGIPAALLFALVAAVDGPATAAYVGIPISVTAYVTIIPSMACQSLLAELADESADVPVIAVGALRLCYVAVIPVAVALVVLAPYVLLVFGHVYSVRGTANLRWATAGTVFSTFNYVGDTVLLARQKIGAYNLVNVLGTIAILACIAAALSIGASWIAPAWALGQLLYAGVAAVIVLRHGSLSAVLAAVRGLRWRL